MEWSAMILGLIFNSLTLVLRPLFWLLTRGKKIKLPPIRNGLLYWSATELARKIRKKHLTSEEVIQAYIDRIREVNPIINAVVQERFSKALEEARAVDTFLNETNISEDDLESKKPLLGVPLTAKESCSLKGMKMTLGSLSQIDEIAAADGDPIQKLKRAGAIPLLISNNPEYCTSWDTANYVTGRTNNPYNTTRSAGGSSGGEGALLGSGASVIGVGSDFGGSVRIPSLFNGVFGHKPTRHIVSIENHMPKQEIITDTDMLVVGPLCRYAEDLTVMLKVMTGDTENKLGLDDEVDLGKLNVFFMECASNPFTQIPVQKEMKEAVNRAVEHLRNKCNSKIQSTKFLGLSRGDFIIMPTFMALDVTKPGMDFGIKDPINFSLYKEFLNLILGKSQYTVHLLFLLLKGKISQYFFSGRSEEFSALGSELKTYMMSKLGTNGVFLYPNYPMSAYYPLEFALTSTGLMYTQVFNVFGFPATAVPLGSDKDGLPVGIQVIAGPNQDKLCIAVAKELSKMGGWVPPS